MNQAEIWDKVQEVWTVEANGILNLSKVVDPQAVTKVVGCIAQCKGRHGRVLAAGVGTSGAAAKKIAHSLSCIEVPSFFLSPADGVHGALGALQPEDVVIAISKGGGTAEILNILPAIKTKGAILIGVTEKPESTLGKASDILLRVHVDREPDPFNMLATASTMAVVAVFDAIAIALMYETGYQREQFAVIHPGGAVGERLLKGDK